MKIAIVSKSNRYAGGASRVAEDLMLWLNQAGHPTDYFVAFPNQNQFHDQEHSFHGLQHSLYGNKLSAILCQKIHDFTDKLGFRELLPVEYWFSLSQVIDDYDVIHFHDLFTAISPITLALVAQRKPTFFTVHDCSAFTGGCLYPMECEKFKSHCHQCPQLRQNTWKERIRDRTREIQAIKQCITKQFDIRYIFPSHWIAKQANLALKFKLSPVVIPNGIALSSFDFKNKSSAKASLGIVENRQVLLISALSLSDDRKGTIYAIKAVQSVVDLNPIVITVGKPNEKLRQALQGLETMEMGFIADPYLMSQVYLASDIMLFCSLADNLPLTVLEAMAAATVIVGFDTGGVPEMIDSGCNGVLVEPKNQEELNQALRQTMLSNNLEKMAEQARIDVETNFSKELFLENHLKIYQETQN